MTGATAERAPQRHEDDEPRSHEPDGMTRAERTANLIGVVVPFLGLLAAVVLLWNSWVDGIDLAIMAVDVRAVRLRRHGRLPPAADAPRVPDPQGRSSTCSRCSARWACRARCSTGSPTTASTTRTPTRRATRTARTSATAPGLRGPVARAHRLAVRDPRPGRLEAYATELYEDRGMRRIGKAFPWLALASLGIPTLLGFVAARLHARGRAARPRLGRPRARVLPAPRDVVDQLGLPLLRPPPLRDRGPLDQRRLARAARRSARPGTTTTTRSRARPRTACAAWELDPSGLVIRAMRRLGLAWNVVQISPERQQAKLQGS